RCISPVADTWQERESTMSVDINRRRAPHDGEKWPTSTHTRIESMKRSVLFVSLLLAACATTAQSSSMEETTPLPLSQNGGRWDSGHVQGIAVDVQGGYIYYSFTDLLARYDF